jgi:hypothetical protein
MPDKDRLPSTLLTGAEVISELRLDCDDYRPDRSDIKAYALRRLKYLRQKRAIPFVRVGHRSYVYPRQGIERFKKQNTVEAAE